MSSTFLQLTNKLLRRLNDVELTPQNFASARGVQALCRDAIADSVSAVNAYCFEWPFNAYEHTQNLIPGTNEYGWPEGFKVADWKTFQIHDSRTGRFDTLGKINRDIWYERFRDQDYGAGSSGRGCPKFVFESHGRGFGVTPVPDYSFDLTFRYYIMPKQLRLHSDQTTIPEEWEWVVIQGALYHGNLFKEDENGSQIAEGKFDKSLASMRTILVNKTEDMQGPRIIKGNRF